MASIYLIRHGQASFGQENYDQLSELGQKQATHLGQAIAQRVPNIDQVVLGGMQRHRQTAENCLAGYELRLADSGPMIDAGWNEYDHQNILAQLRPEYQTATGMTEYIAAQKNPKQVFEQDFNAAIDRWTSGQFDADYVETWQDYRQRVLTSLQRVVDASKTAKNLFVFTSGGPISVVAQHLLGVPAEQIMRMNWTLMNCAVTKLVTTSDRVFLSTLNEHTHFEGADNKHLITYT